MSATLANQSDSPRIDRMIGTWRRFGALGPVYEIVGRTAGSVLRVRVLESGEELDYPLAHALDDPTEA